MPGMHRIAASVLGLGLVAAVACGGKGGERAAVAVTGAEVGTVLEVEGDVTASRAGQARPLAVGQRVHDDDVVATGGGRVAIQLDKNNVVWRLGPRLTQQVARLSTATCSVRLHHMDCSGHPTHPVRTSAAWAAIWPPMPADHAQ